MVRQILSLIFTCIAIQAQAQNCPDFYRFVDFGQIGEDGITYRGGTILRAESLTGTSLLMNAKTACVSVTTRAADGHGNPIPVVTSVSYDPFKTDLPISSLRVMRSSDIAAAATANAASHHARLNEGDITQVQGANFLCASDGNGRQVSCQLVSPFAGDHPLVVYCDLSECRMPVMAMTEHLSISATWPSSAIDLSAQGLANATRIMEIHDFLAELF